MYKIVAKIKTKIRLFHHGHKYRRFVEISFASEIFLFIIYEYWKGRSDVNGGQTVITRVGHLLPLLFFGHLHQNKCLLQERCHYNPFQSRS